MCWVAGTVVGFLPLFGWHADVSKDHTCHFVKVMDYSYLVFLYFATIITPAILMLAFYAHIYRVIIKQVRQIVTMNPVGDSSRRSSSSQITMTTPSSRPCQGGTMLRVLGASRKRDVKATQNLSIIVLFFMICWFPLYTINCIKAFCNDCEVHPKLTLFCIILSHLNSAGNPVLYAYHLKDFRLALKNLILKVLGVEIEPHAEAIHRFSLASQHRLQSIDANMRNSLQPRVYVDSPIWLRQQQERVLKNPPKCGVVTPCLNNIHQTVAAVASVTTDIERQMWNIMEASSGAEIDEVNYEFPENTSNKNSPPTPPPRQHRPATVLSVTSTEEGGSSVYSYDNCNYYVSQEEIDAFDEVFLPNGNNNNNNNNSTSSSSKNSEHKELNNSSIVCSMHEKLRSDGGEYQSKMLSRQSALTDASYSDYENPKENTQKHLQTSNGKLLAASLNTTPPPKPPRLAQRQQQLRQSSVSQPSSSSSCLTNSAIYVIDNDTTPLSPTPTYKRRFKKSSQRLPMNFTKTTMTISRSCSCTSDSTSPTKDSVPAALPAAITPCMEDSNGNSGSLSLSNAAASGGCGGENATFAGINNHNSQTIHNLNYYAFHHPHQLPHTLQHHTDKFSPLKAMSHILLPPIVKHSSLFHLFQPTFPTESDIDSCSETTTTETITITTTATKTTTTTTTCSSAIDDATKKLSNDLRIGSSNVSSNNCTTVTTKDVVDSPRTATKS